MATTTGRKLLFYIHALAGGGAERVIARLATGFAARGDDVILVVERDAPETRKFVSDAVTVKVLDARGLRAVVALARLIVDTRPDICLSALGGANLKLFLAAIPVGALRRTILSYHGFYENEPEPSNRLSYLLTPVLSRFAAATVAVSQALRATLISRHYAPESVEVIYNPSVPECPPPMVDASRLAAREPLVIGMGRLTKDKNFGLLLRAFAHVSYPGARLALLGKGPEAAAIREAARELGILDKVSLPGFVADTDAFLAQARCLVSPSRQEAFGLVIVEALHHGVPVVATDAGGPREILATPEIGRIVPVQDEKKLGAAIQAALETPGDPVARQKVASSYSLDSSLLAYDRLFRRVMGT